MKLYYFKRQDGRLNFGDDLNQWLWDKLLPDAFQVDDGTVLVGMGTLINSRLPKRTMNARNVIIFSTGAGYEKPLEKIPDHWKIYCVRGPLSAQQLGISNTLAITDGAILIRLFYHEKTNKKYKFSFMPHVSSAIWAGNLLEQVCHQLGFGYINPSQPVDDVLRLINQTEVLLAEAMHGAIAADTLRVPWVPIKTTPRILSLKWHDWCRSMSVPYHPHYIFPLSGIYPRLANKKIASRRTLSYWQSASKSLSHWGNSIMQHPSFLSHLLSGNTEQNLENQLLYIAKKGIPTLSSDSNLERLTNMMESQINQLKNDWL